MEIARQANWMALTWLHQIIIPAVWWACKLCIFIFAYLRRLAWKVHNNRILCSTLYSTCTRLLYTSFRWFLSTPHRWWFTLITVHFCCRDPVLRVAIPGARWLIAMYGLTAVPRATGATTCPFPRRFCHQQSLTSAIRERLLMIVSVRRRQSLNCCCSRCRFVFVTHSNFHTYWTNLFAIASSTALQPTCDTTNCLSAKVISQQIGFAQEQMKAVVATQQGQKQLQTALMQILQSLNATLFSQGAQ